jgi:hypothetical protein
MNGSIERTLFLNLVHSITPHTMRADHFSTDMASTNQTTKLIYQNGSSSSYLNIAKIVNSSNWNSVSAIWVPQDIFSDHGVEESQSKSKTKTKTLTKPEKKEIQSLF